MSLEQPLVPTNVPPIPEEGPQSTPVAPRRDSKDNPADQETVAEKIKIASKSQSGDFAEMTDVNKSSSNSTASGDVQKSEAGVATPSSAQNGTSRADDSFAEHRKSVVPMSTMEEENLRERLRQAQLKKCNEIVFKEPRYTRDTFRRLFQTKVGFLSVFYVVVSLAKLYYFY